MMIGERVAYRTRLYHFQLNSKQNRCIGAVRPVKHVIDAIGVIDATLRVATQLSLNTCRRPPTWLPARQVPRAKCGMHWHPGPVTQCDALVPCF